MAVRWYSLVWDAHDLRAQATWWAQVLDWAVVYESDDEWVIVPRHVAAAEGPGGGDPMAMQGQGWVFVPVPEGKQVKNRLHIDLAPRAGEDHEEAVQRIIDLGARRVDVGQDESSVTWAVLADPEGNEFCMLSPRD